MSEEEIETALRKGEILLDGGTQKLLRSLAYIRHLRQLITKNHGSWQWTLTHPKQSNAMRKTDYGKKKWHMGVPKQKDKPIEFGLWAECWHCNRTFQKKLFCRKCGYAICPECAKCGCQLPECCREAVRKTIRAVFGLVPLPPAKRIHKK